MGIGISFRDRGAVLGFLVATAYWPTILSAATSPRWWIIAIGACLVSWLDPRRLLPSAALALCLFVGYSALTLLWSPDAWSGAGDLIHFIIFSLALVAAAELSEDDFDACLCGVAWGLGISSALVIGQSLGWSPVDQVASPAGLFLNRDLVAEVSALVLVWAAAQRRWGCLALVAPPLILCGSRTALGTVAVGGAFLLPRRWSVVLLVAGLLIVLALSAFDFKGVSFGRRIDAWEWTYRHITLWGMGLGTVVHSYWETTHSDVLQAICETSFAAIGLVALFAIAAWRAAGIDRALVASCALQALVAFPLRAPASAFVVAVVLGYMLRRGARVCGSEYGGRDRVVDNTQCAGHVA